MTDLNFENEFETIGKWVFKKPNIRSEEVEVYYNDIRINGVIGVQFLDTREVTLTIATSTYELVTNNLTLRKK